MVGKAKARLIYSSISTSERVASLGLKGALLFTWLLAHCDGQGRYAGSARKVKAEVAPMLDEITVDDVEEALGAMEAARLIVRYSDERFGSLMQVADWWEYNAGLRIREPSRYPPPEDWEDDVTGRDAMGRFVSPGDRLPE